MATHPGRLGVALATIGATLFLAASDAPRHATGAIPVDHAVYARLPKVQRHRAWLPTAVDLTDRFPAPGDQGIESDCVEWATVYAARSFLRGDEIGHRPVQPAELASPTYIFNRLRPAGSSCAVPTQVKDALDLLKTEGVVSLADFPDDWRKCRVPAPASLKEKAGALRIDGWRAIDRETKDDWRTPLILDDVKGSLARGAPVVFAMPVSDAFQHWKGGRAYTQAASENKNWHAMALVGYDETRQAFKLINSWGQDWGDHGYAWIDYVTFKTLAGEAYAIERPPATSQPLPTARPGLSPMDQLRTVAATLPCSAVSAQEENGHPLVTGFGGGADALDAAKAAALKADPSTVWQVAYHPWPQCEAETTLAAQLHGSAVRLHTLTDDGRPLDGDPLSMRGGQKFGILAEAPADKPYLEVIYLQADGSAVELYRGSPPADPQGMRSVSLGVSGKRQARFEVSEPFGDEILIALASTQPLFGDDLPSHATERQFLTALRAHLVASPRGSVSSAVLRLKTRA